MNLYLIQMTNSQLLEMYHIVGARCASAVVTKPLWVVKTRFQVFILLLLLYCYDDSIYFCQLQHNEASSLADKNLKELILSLFLQKFSELTLYISSGLLYL
jgi:hypothetical protein